MKGKRIVSLLVTLIVVSTMILGIPAFAASSSAASDSLATVYDYVEAINSQDWDKYVSLSPRSEYENLMEFLFNKEYAAENIGVHNVKSAEIVDIRELVPMDLPQYILVEDIAGEMPQENVKAYLIAANLEVKEETKYHYNGVNMFTVLLARESGTWKVFSFSAAPASIIQDVYANIRSAENFDVNRMIEIATKHQNSIWENISGDVIEDNRATTDQIIEEMGGTENYISKFGVQAQSATSHNRPGNIRIALCSNRVVNNIVTVEFYDAIKNTLPNEWYSTWKPESLKAGAQCVKMVIWSMIVNPWYPNSGYDMRNDTQGSYRPNTEVASCTQAINAVGGIGMENSDGDIFYAAYSAGRQGSLGDKTIGNCSQWGSQKLAQEGKTYFYILDYYYSYTCRSEGAIREFTY